MDTNNDYQAADGTADNSFDDTPKSRIEITPEGERLTYSLPSLHYRYAEHIGKRGFSNGLLRIPPETFEKYIEAYEENKRMGVVISQMEREAQGKEDKIRNTESERDRLMADIVRKKQERARQTEEKDRFADRLQKIGERMEEIRQQFKNQDLAYGWIGTFLFLTAGLIFIITDVSIIRTIAYMGFDLLNQEALIFAIGFASLAIVLKPLVDRVFEKPYQNENKLPMHRLLIFIGLATVLALGLMGKFRNDAFLANKREALEEEFERLDNERSRGERDISDPEILELEEKLKTLPETSSSDTVMYIFISSSILFALAGAICFSIGVPSFRSHANRVSGKTALFFQRRYYLRRLEQADKGWRFAENEWKISEQRLALLPNLAILEAELKRIINELQLARVVQHQAHTEAVLAIYRDNYHRGERYIPTEEELAEFEILLSEQNGIKQKNFQLNRQFSGSNLFNSQYLHEYIRQKIHKDNKQKVTQNGQVHYLNGIK
jgi:hypothetical protein